MRTWLASKLVTRPLAAMVSVCLACATLAFALGTLIPWPFLQNAAADFVGGLLAGLLIFGLANIAFGFTERREKERHALRIAFGMLLFEMLDNYIELSRIVRGLQEGSLTRDDPVFGPSERFKAENWQLLAQSPLAAHLAADLFWTIGNSYDLSRSFVSNLRNEGLALGAGNRQAWHAFCRKHVMDAEAAGELVTSAQEKLRVARQSMERS